MFREGKKAKVGLVIFGILFLANFSWAKVEKQENALLLELTLPINQIPPDVINHLKQIGVKDVQFKRLPYYVKLVFDDKVNIEEAKKVIQGMEIVKNIEYCYLLEADATPGEEKNEIQTEIVNSSTNDPLINKQWALSSIKLFDAWEIEEGNEDVKIAIIDTGIDSHHPDLTNIVDLNLSKNYLNPGSFPEDDSLTGHGTHIAGIISAVVNNGVGIAGVMQKARLIIYKVFDKNGKAPDDLVADAIIDATNSKIEIINMSFGGQKVSSYFQKAIKYAYDKGVFLVAEAGDERSKEPFYPAAYSEVLGVTIIDKEGKPYYQLTNYNPERKLYYELAAPGVDILSALPGGKYGVLSGSSCSAAFVTGVAGLLLSKDRNLPNEEIRRILIGNSDGIIGELKDKDIGLGRLNAYNALTGAKYMPEDWKKKAFGLIAKAYVQKEGQKLIIVKPGEEVKFLGQYSQSPNGAPLQYLWSFGDGFTSQEVNPTHVYKKEDIYDVIMTAFTEKKMDEDKVKVIVTNKKVWRMGIKKNSISIPEEETDMEILSENLKYLSSQGYTVAATTPSNPGNGGGGGNNPGCGAGVGQWAYQFKLGPVTITIGGKFQYVPGQGFSCVP